MMTDVFYAFLPLYMTFGMTAEEFWNCNPRMYKIYRHAFYMKKQSANEEMYVNGIYTLKAVDVVITNIANAILSKSKREPLQYFNKPLDIWVEKTPEQRAEEEQRRNEINLERAKASLRALERNYKALRG